MFICIILAGISGFIIGKNWEVIKDECVYIKKLYTRLKEDDKK
jgi:flagellar motor component MotA